MPYLTIIDDSGVPGHIRYSLSPSLYPPPTFFHKSIIPGQLFLRLHKNIILKPLAARSCGMRDVHKLHVLKGLSYSGLIVRAGWFAVSRVSCKSMILCRLFFRLRNSIIPVKLAQPRLVEVSAGCVCLDPPPELLFVSAPRSRILEQEKSYPPEATGRGLE